MDKGHDNYKAETPKIGQKPSGHFDLGFSTQYLVQAWAGGEWYHSNSFKTLIGAKREKAHMEKISAIPRRIIRQTREVLQEC